MARTATVRSAVASAAAFVEIGAAGQDPAVVKAAFETTTLVPSTSASAPAISRAVVESAAAVASAVSPAAHGEVAVVLPVGCVVRSATVVAAAQRPFAEAGLTSILLPCPYVQAPFDP